ncbi:uncharacterized protein LOC111629966 isoform X1 [Centruroides sculpturatus]|uniref:uncharacterized protein LOC111629966 isoform X1 n=2 Tax=Centruroides sculpturatus TaxID=218467 RepID=UPI000C6EEF8D|nr:uncharacterized protein LOC111629966 isoform X1 [Centruroides sculpturatus]
MSLSSRYAMSTLLIMLTYLHLMFSSPICSTNGYYNRDKIQDQSKLYLLGPQYCPETGRTVCTNVAYYPEDRILLILSKTKAQGFNLSSLFFDEREGDAYPNLSQLPNMPYDQPTSVHHDFIVPQYSHSTWSKKSHSVGKRSENSEPACATRSEFVFPRAALNDKSQWKYVINLPNRNPNYKQIVRIELCAYPGSSCSSQLSFPFGYESRCVQKHIKKKLLSLDSTGETISEDPFFVPSCCVCQLVRNFKR